MRPHDRPAAPLTRRDALRLAALGAGALGLQPILAACGGVKGSGGSTSPNGGAASKLKIGYVSPQTGALAPFGEADTFVVNALKQRFAAGIPAGGGAMAQVDIVVKDSASDSSRAATAAAELINGDKVDLVLVASTPDTTNPVSDQCEANGIPCISTVAPWQSWFIGRGGKPGTSTFTWTYHFFWGLEDLIAVYSDMWSQLPDAKGVGALWPNDADGTAFAMKGTGFPDAITKAGYTLTEPGRYDNGTQDYGAQISRYKSARAQILTGVPIPPDWTTFYKQATQQGYKPKLVTVAKALLFPSAVEALGALGQNVGTEVWWTPRHPFTSSLTQQSAQSLADAYTATTGKQWTQPIGFVHALFEVAAAALAKAPPGDKRALATAMKTLSVNTVRGPLDWSKGPVPNVAKTPLVGGQWRKGTKTPYDLIVVSNKDHPEIPSGSKVEAIA